MSGAAHNEEVVATVETPLHRAPAECKVLATVLFVIAVALVPRGQLVWPYAVDAALLLAVAVVARTSTLACWPARLVIEVPFVLFVLVLPFVAEDGLWLAFGIVAKATLAVLATGVLAWTTPRAGDPARRRAAARCRARWSRSPASRCATCRWSLDELRRMRLARVQRGDDAALAVAVARRRRGASARSPCARSSAASACTSRCSRAATTAGCRRCELAPRRAPLAWAARASASPAAAAGSVTVGVAIASAAALHGRRPRHPRRGRARGVLDARRARARGRGRAARRVRVHRARRAAGGRRDRRARRARQHATSSPIPLVLLAAGHLKNDGPAALTRARMRHPGVAFRMGRDLGIDPVVLDGRRGPGPRGAGGRRPGRVRGRARRARVQRPRRHARTSTRSRGCSPTGAGSGWSSRRSRASRSRASPEALERCRRLGATQIAVVPFFLFTGVLVPRIYAQAAE